MGPGCQNFSRQFNDYSNDNDYSKLAPDIFKGDLSRFVHCQGEL